MVINVLCESSLIELNNPFSNMTLDEAFNMFTENVNIALNEEKVDDSGSYIRHYGEDKFIYKGDNVNRSKIKNIIESIITQISKLWDKFIEFIQNFTSMVMKKFLSIGIDKKKSWNLINNMKEDFTVTIKGTVVPDDQYDKIVSNKENASYGLSNKYIDLKDKDIHTYFSKYRRVDYEYKITKQVGINAWNTIFNSKSKFVSGVIENKNNYIKSMKNQKNIDPFYNEEENNTSNDSEIKHMAQVATQVCKEEISVYRDYLKTCAKVLKAIIDHGGDSKYNEPDYEYA